MRDPSSHSPLMGTSELRMVPSLLAAGAGTGVPLFPRHSEEQQLALRGMVPSPTPKRDHGDPQAFGFEARAKGSGARGGTTPLVPWPARFSSPSSVLC